MTHDLLSSLDKLHSTKGGIERIRKNLDSDITDPVLWCKTKIENADSIVKKGKNWYVYADDCVITVNTHSFTIITAHIREGKK